MTKKNHEICDPIHTFIRLSSEERRVVDSCPLQRLRNINQLALTYLVYPGATHKRFDHSLGVMELAGRVFDVITNQANLHEQVRDIIPEEDELKKWRRILRIAALCHDIGHLPFSHSAESELFKKESHEDITVRIIQSDFMKELWDSIELDSDDIVKLAVEPDKIPDIKLNNWEALLSEIIIGNAFGVDRMDYLLRDSHYTGVVSGKFDHSRLIDTIRILPKQYEGSDEPALGVEEGGLRCAEALLLARYFMFSQVYFHPIRRIYDLHLRDFLRLMFSRGYPVEIDEFLKITDNEILVEIFNALRNNKGRKHKEANKILNRKHYKLLDSITFDDQKKKMDALNVIFGEARKKFGEDNLKRDEEEKGGGAEDFPVLTRTGRIVSSISHSKVLREVPFAQAKYIFASREIINEAKKWLEQNREELLKDNNKSVH